MEQKYILAIDLGGTKINGVIINSKGQIIVKETIKTLSEKGENVVLSRIYSVIDELIKKSGIKLSQIESIGICSAGRINANDGIIKFAANLPFSNFNIAKTISEKYKVEVYIENDANAAALGEYTLGAAQGRKNMLYVTISTGIGGGAVLNGKLYRGNTCNGLEIGHMTIVENGPLCKCGNEGCAQMLASGTAIRNRAYNRIKEGEQSSLDKYKDFTAYEVFLEASKGDKLSQEIIDESLNHLGTLISNLITIFDPEIVVLGGGVTKQGDIVFDKIKEVTYKRCYKETIDSCRIVQAKLDGDSGVLGAAILALNKGNA